MQHLQVEQLLLMQIQGQPQLPSLDEEDALELKV